MYTALAGSEGAEYYLIKPLQGLISGVKSPTPGCTGGYSYLATFVAIIIIKHVI